MRRSEGAPQQPLGIPAGEVSGVDSNEVETLILRFHDLVTDPGGMIQLHQTILDKHPFVLGTAQPAVGAGRSKSRPIQGRSLLKLHHLGGTLRPGAAHARR